MWSNFIISQRKKLKATSGTFPYLEHVLLPYLSVGISMQATLLQLWTGWWMSCEELWPRLQVTSVHTHFEKGFMLTSIDIGNNNVGGYRKKPKYRLTGCLITRLHQCLMSSTCWLKCATHSDERKLHWFHYGIVRWCSIFTVHIFISRMLRSICAFLFWIMTVYWLQKMLDFCEFFFFITYSYFLCDIQDHTIKNGREH